MNSDDRIYVAGHTGLVGGAIHRRLEEAGYEDIVTRTHDQLDLVEQDAVRAFFDEVQPDHVFLAAAKVGGILANREYPADFIYDNLMIQSNVIDAAHRSGVDKLCFLGSSCVYPKHAPQPMKEDHLLTGPLEPTNQWYAVAKIAGIKTCQAYRRQHGFDAICLQPTNVYGPGDNFDLETSHVMAALIRKFHEATVDGADEVTLWGTGKPRREFIYVDDLADAILFLMDNYSDEEIINVGTGEDLSINELAKTIQDIVGFEGDIVHDTDKPEGTPRKLLDVSKLEKLGWQPSVGIREGIERTYEWYREHAKEVAG